MLDGWLYAAQGYPGPYGLPGMYDWPWMPVWAAARAVPFPAPLYMAPTFDFAVPAPAADSTQWWDAYLFAGPDLERELAPRPRPRAVTRPRRPEPAARPAPEVFPEIAPAQPREAYIPPFAVERAPAAPLAERRVPAREAPVPPNRWEDWRTLPGSTTTTAPAVLSHAGNLWVFIRDGEGGVSVTAAGPDGDWFDWYSIPGTRTDLRPTPVSAGSAVHLFFVQPDGRVYMTSLTEGVDWSQPAAVPAGPTRSPVGAIAVSGGIMLFYRGQDNRVYLIQGAPGDWSEPVLLPEMETDEQPVPVLFGGEVAVMVKDFEGMHWYGRLLDDRRWSRWQKVPRPERTYTPVGATVYRDDLWVFSQYPDFTVWFNAVEPGWGWQTWREVPLARTDNAPAPVTHGGRLYLFVRSRADSQVIYTIRREP